MTLKEPNDHTPSSLGHPRNSSNNPDKKFWNQDLHLKFTNRDMVKFFITISVISTSKTHVTLLSRCIRYHARRPNVSVSCKSNKTKSFDNFMTIGAIQGVEGQGGDTWKSFIYVWNTFKSFSFRRLFNYSFLVAHQILKKPRHEVDFRSMFQKG
jgi:hypothetical protein